VRVISFVIAVVALTATSIAPAQDGDPDVARNLAATCTTCHGTNGVSVGGIDSIAGQSKDELVRKLRDFRSGTRPGTIMPQLAKGYTDAQIELIGGWFAIQRTGR
jgi:cytochrome c553